jgi:hypothetical protein
MISKDITQVQKSKEREFFEERQRQRQIENHKNSHLLFNILNEGVECLSFIFLLHRK